MCGWIGDPIDKLELCVFSDADWAGEKTTYKSTTGSCTCLVGLNFCFPISALSKKQTCVSHSTPKAEIVAADTSIRNEGIPALNLWEILNNKPPKSLSSPDHVHWQKLYNATHRQNTWNLCGMAVRKI